MNYIKRKLPFIQHNENKQCKTCFQCPNCLSYETDKEHIFNGPDIIYINRICYDCGYTTLYKAFTKGVMASEQNKQYYKYATIPDTVEPPIDYEDTKAYKDNEPWFSGMGRC